MEEHEDEEDAGEEVGHEVVEFIERMERIWKKLWNANRWTVALMQGIIDAAIVASFIFQAKIPHSSRKEDYRREFGFQ